MQGEINSKFPPSSQKYVLFFALLLGVFIVLGPYMAYKKTGKLDLDIQRLEQEIKKQSLFAEAARNLEIDVQLLENDIERNTRQKRPGGRAGNTDPSERFDTRAGRESGQGQEMAPESLSPSIPGYLSPIKKQGLSLRETTDIGITLGAMAREAGIKVLAIHPDVSFLTGSQEEIVVDARVSGSFRGLWTFLHRLGSHPAFKEFVSMEIREIPLSREMHIKVRFFTEG